MNKIEELEEKISTMKELIADPDLDADMKTPMENALKKAQSQLDILNNASNLKVVEDKDETKTTQKPKKTDTTIDSIVSKMMSLAGFISRNEGLNFRTEANAKASSLLKDKLAHTYVEQVLELGGDLKRKLSDKEQKAMREALGASVDDKASEESKELDKDVKKPKAGRPKLLEIKPQVPGKLVLTEALKQRGVLQEDIDLSNKIQRTITVIFVHKQVRNTVDQDKDENIVALEPGLRLKPDGTLYYENRENRSDMNSGMSKMAA